MDRFIPWAVLDMWVGRFRCSCGPFWILPWAVLDISKIYGPFWFKGRFGIDPKETLSSKSMSVITMLLLMLLIDNSAQQ